MDITQQYFTCKKCGESKASGEFAKNRPNSNNHRTVCRQCRNAIDRNRDRVTRNEYHRKWEKENPEKVAAHNKSRSEKIKNNEEMREKRRLTLRKYRAANPAKFIEYRKKYIDALPDCIVVDWLNRKGFSRELTRENPELIEIQRTIIQTKRLCKI